jgi:hypothetical protein
MNPHHSYFYNINLESGKWHITSIQEKKQNDR